MKTVLALTGGIASGKSECLALMFQLYPRLEAFDCDACVKELLASDQTILELLKAAFGVGILDKSGALDKAALRKDVFANAEKKKALEDIVHPRVREECLARKAEWSKSGESSLFVADVPLLFENGFDFGYNHSVVVAVSRETQISRIKARNGYEDDLINQILAAQWSLSKKVECGTFILWNEGSPQVLEAQLKTLFHHLHII